MAYLTSSIRPCLPTEEDTHSPLGFPNSLPSRDVFGSLFAAIGSLSWATSDRLVLPLNVPATCSLSGVKGGGVYPEGGGA